MERGGISDLTAVCIRLLDRVSPDEGPLHCHPRWRASGGDIPLLGSADSASVVWSGKGFDEIRGNLLTPLNED